MKATIYHNARCSKSRETLALLTERGLEPNIVNYLDTPPDAATLRHLIVLLGFDDARQLMRQKEEEYAALGLNDSALTQTELIEAMVAHPRLIERPIVVIGERAAIGRPPENVLALLARYRDPPSLA
jgi:arsenate reductase